MCKANQTARLRTTPTTAAMMPRSAAFKARFPRSRSIQGAPANTKKKHGAKVTQVAAIIGCGVQGVAQLRALARVRRLARASAYDVRPDAARSLADTLAPELGIPIAVASDITQATSAADLIVICTPSREFLLGPDAVRPGAFVAGVGVDAKHKWELEPALFAGSTVAVDVLDQCAAFGDLHHALAAGAITREAVHAELGEVVAGRKPGRTHPDEIVVLDSTGMALLDVTAAVAVYQRARERGMGTPIDFAG